jgi:hypothetical protein
MSHGMNKRMWTGVLLFAGALLALSVWSSRAGAVEQLPYRLVRTFDGIEVRDYRPYLVAVVTVPGPAEAAGNQGFRILARYIFGDNQGERKIAMTAPVIQEPRSTKIAMTAPVIESPSAGNFVLQFVMPGSYTRETLPQPRDPRIRIEEMPAARYAVIRYSGSWSSRNYRAHLEQLEHTLGAAGLKTTGDPLYARYNAPFVPWFLRRNEIWLRLS